MSRWFGILSEVCIGIVIIAFAALIVHGVVEIIVSAEC